MNIALIGVPGSGKSALAKTIENAILHEEFSGCTECRTPVAIVDEYAEAVAFETGYAIGFNTGYVPNLYVALERHKAERAAMGKAKTVITCGSLLETATYAAQEAAVTLNLTSEEEDKKHILRRTEAIIRTLACMYTDLFVNYSAVYYLPPLKQADGSPPSEEIMEMDRNLQISFQSFNLVPVKPLIVPGDDMLKITANRCTLVIADLFGLTEEGDEGILEGAGDPPQAAE